MKKLTCLMLSAVFALGTLPLFAGCTKQKINDEAKEAEVLSALNSVEVSAFELSMESHSTASKKSGEHYWSEAESKQSMSVVAYEEDGQVYGDMLIDTYKSSAYEAGFVWGVHRESSSTYDLSFARGDVAYTTEGSWENINVKAGDFDALLKDYRTSTRALIAKDIFSDFEAEDVEKYAALGTIVKGNVYSVFGGYRIEYDLVDGVATVLKRLTQASKYYAKNPDITVAELFEAAQMAGLEDIVFLGDEYGKRPASELFGEPGQFLNTLNRAIDNPVLFLLENRFGYPEGDDRTAVFSYTLTIELDTKMNFKRLDMKMDLDLDMLSDQGETKTEADGMMNLTVKALSKPPKLLDLSGLHAQTRRPVADEYDFSVDGVLFGYPVDYGSYIKNEYLKSTVSGHIVVDDTGIATFTIHLVSHDDDGRELVNETGTAAIDLIRDVDYGDYIDRMGKAMFFEDLHVTLASGEVVKTDGQWLGVSFVGSHYYVELGGYEPVVLEMNAVLEIITL